MGRWILRFPREPSANRRQQIASGELHEFIDSISHHAKRKAFAFLCVVEITRLELVTYTLRTYRATNCAISPN